MHVVDGGFLLHRVVWGCQISFAMICANYIHYITRHYGPNTIVVFDGYPECETETGTKSAERNRRSKQQSSTDVIFDKSMIPTVSQEKFLSNSFNKRRLIAMLQTKLEAQNYTFKQAVEDADTLIVQTAIELASSFSSVHVIGEDVDLLVLLTAKAREIPNVYFRKPGRGNKEDVFYSPQSFQYNDSIAKCILFVHAFNAFSGCDTTSALFNQGKIRFLKTLEKNPTLTEAIQVFDDPNAELTEVVAAGELFMLRQYGAGSKHRTLDSLCGIRTLYGPSPKIHLISRHCHQHPMRAIIIHCELIVKSRAGGEFKNLQKIMDGEKQQQD